MPNKMAWLHVAGNENKTLHLQLTEGQPFRPYTAFSGLKVPDHKIPGGSKGWATYQKLLKEGWTIVPSDQVQHLALPAIQDLKPAIMES